MCGALKNVYAILAGLKGLKRETPEWRAFISDAAHEMQLVLEANGAQPDTVGLVCGVGDLKLTCGNLSRNYEYGVLLKQNPDYQPTNTVEGLTTIKRIARREIIVPKKALLLTEVLNAIK